MPKLRSVASGTKTVIIATGAETVIIVAASIVMIHIGQRVTAREHKWLKRNVPFELVELDAEGIGEDEVVVDELTIRATGAIGDTPAQRLERAGQDLTNAVTVLKADFVGMGMVTEAAGLDDGEEAPADLGFFLLGEFDRDDAGGEGRSSRAQRPSPTPVASMTMCWGCQVSARALSLPKTARWFSPIQL